MRNDPRDSSETSGRLVHLSDTDRFDIPDSEPDVRGWTARTADGRKLGKVEDLLVDTGVGRIRYLELALSSDAEDASGREYALVPVGAARLDEDKDDVIVSDRAAERAGLPRYERKNVSRDYERSVRTYYADERSDARATGDDDFYGHPSYDDRSFFGSRRRGREDSPYLSRRAD